MAASSSHLQNLSQASDESMRALIQAIIPEAGFGVSSNLSEDAVNRLTEKLSELMGPQAGDAMQPVRNERGELVNEEGQPIIDITEPDIESPARSLPPPITVEPLVPLATLPDSVRQKLHEKRNRILDILEEEERKAELAEKKREEQERTEALRKRKEDAAREKDRLKNARELQKKMGRALLENVGKAKAKEEEEKAAQRQRDEEENERRKSPATKKKTVTFVDTPEETNIPEGQSERTNWGDITPARLRSKKPALLSQSLLDKHPMKRSVVERIPGGQPTIHKPAPASAKVPDSDDESDMGSISDLSTEESNDEDKPELESDEVDIDFAQHQREIALAYYKKRDEIGEDARAAMTDYSRLFDDEDHDNDVPEAIRDTSKPAISQFKANRLASAYNASSPKSSQNQSISLDTSILPASSARTIQNSIKMGKLDDEGHLVGVEDDSASEDEDRAVQNIVELLKKGEIYNLGPNGEYVHFVPPRQPQPAASTSGLPISLNPPQKEASTPNIRSKTSKFKASRAAAGRPSTFRRAPMADTEVPDIEIASPSQTPVSDATRSSPKLPESIKPAAMERAMPFAGKPHNPHAPPPNMNHPAFSMIVDSPSFPMPTGATPPVVSSTSLLDSMPSSMVSSPPHARRSSRRPERPPTIIAASVLERTSSMPASIASSEPSTFNPEKKISRFKTQRM